MAEFCFLVVCLLINAASELEQCTHLISDYILDEIPVRYKRASEFVRLRGLQNRA